MIDFDKQLVEALLETGKKVYYELFCDSNTPKPCITYLQSNDAQGSTGDTLGYSRLQYYIKAWGDDLAELNPLCQEIDNILRELGFTRVSMNTITSAQQICKILLYEATAVEDFLN